MSNRPHPAPSKSPQVSSLNDGIRSLNDNIDRIHDLHSRALSELDEAQHQSITTQLATLTTETSRLTNNLKNRINSLKASTDGLPAGGDTNVRLTQVGALKKRLMDTITKSVSSTSFADGWAELYLPSTPYHPVRKLIQSIIKVSIGRTRVSSEIQSTHGTAVQDCKTRSHT